MSPKAPFVTLVARNTTTVNLWEYWCSTQKENGSKLKINFQRRIQVNHSYCFLETNKKCSSRKEATCILETFFDSKAVPFLILSSLPSQHYSDFQIMLENVTTARLLGLLCCQVHQALGKSCKSGLQSFQKHNQALSWMTKKPCLKKARSEQDVCIIQVCLLLLLLFNEYLFWHHISRTAFKTFGPKAITDKPLILTVLILI